VHTPPDLFGQVNAWRPLPFFAMQDHAEKILRRLHPLMSWLPIGVRLKVIKQLTYLDLELFPSCAVAKHVRKSLMDTWQNNTKLCGLSRTGVDLELGYTVSTGAE
jgi:hypothetical protein